MKKRCAYNMLLSLLFVNTRYGMYHIETIANNNKVKNKI